MGVIRTLLLEGMKWLASVSLLLFNSSDQWAQNTLKSSLLTIGSLLVYLVLTWLGNVSKLARPISVSIELKNVVTRDSFTYYHAESEGNESQRTIRMEVSISKQKSLWSYLARKLLCEKECYISLEALNKGSFVLQSQHDNLVERSEYGINIKLDELIGELLYTDNANVRQEFDLVIYKTKEQGIYGYREIEIVPTCYFDERKVKWWQRLFYQFNFEPHRIRYFPQGH